MEDPIDRLTPDWNKKQDVPKYVESLNYFKLNHFKLFKPLDLFW